MFNDIFIKLLQDNNISAYRFSKDTGIPESLISNWKSGAKIPSFESILKISNYFDVSADYLLELDDTGMAENEKFNPTKYKNDFQKEKYDRLIINVPKGQKAIIQEIAKSQEKSLNAFVVGLIDEAVNSYQSKNKDITNHASEMTSIKLVAKEGGSTKEETTKEEAQE